LLTLAEVTGDQGEAGNFQVQVTQHPRYVDMEKCIACGLCAEKCPKKVVDGYDAGLKKRKALCAICPGSTAEIRHRQDNCLFLQKGKCKACEKFCPTGSDPLR
jgi:heterodisulfide reductase subunit A2